MKGVEKAMLALHGDIVLRTYTSKFTFGCASFFTIFTRVIGGLVVFLVARYDC